MSVPDTTPDHKRDHKREDDAQRWQEAKELRKAHRGWIIIWLASHAEFRAYRRLPGTRRDNALGAHTASDMKTQIMEADRPALSSRQVWDG